MSDEMGLRTKAAMQLFAKIQAHNLTHHPTWDQNMAYLKAIRRVEEEAGAGRAVQEGPSALRLHDGLDVERLGRALDRAMGTQASGVAPSEYRHLVAAYYSERGES